MELELRFVEVQWAHKVGGCGTTLVAREWAPDANSLANIYYYFQKL